jgi:uncharacterized membrane protein
MAAVLDPDAFGPVDVAVITFPGGLLDPDVAPALLELHRSGVLHVVDDAFVTRAPDGTVAIQELIESQTAGAFDDLDSDHLDLLSEADLLQVGSQLDPGSSALVLVWENSWAARLAGAVRASRGEVRELVRIPRADVLTALTALDKN